MMFSLYNKQFDTSICFTEQNASYNKLIKFYPSYITKQTQKEYYGGLVGIHGGLTTLVTEPDGEVRKVGDVAIELLIKAYKLKEIIFKEAINRMTEVIEAHARKINTDVNEEIVNKLKYELLLVINKGLDADFEILSCTGYKRMIARNYLLHARNKVTEELKMGSTNNVTGVGKYLKRYDQAFGVDNWETEGKYYMSVLNRLLWYLITLYNPY